MATLAEKVRTGLDEARMITLAAQVLLGFQLRAFFEPRFTSLPPGGRSLLFAAAVGIASAIALLMFPGAWHRRVDGGHATGRLKRIQDVMATSALALIAVVLSLDFVVAGLLMHSVRLGAILGAGAALIASVLWFGVELMKGKRHGDEPRENVEEVPLHERIDAVLTEARVVLPGVQALLGFEFVMLMMDSFEKLPPVWRSVHVGSLSATALAIALLMMPAAWHRLVERGEDSESFHRLASRLVLAAMVVFAAGLSSELAVIARRLELSDSTCTGVGLAALAAFLFLWFGITNIARARRPRSSWRAGNPREA